MEALTVSKWFIKKQFDTPRNTLKGNMKLQKLLFFSQLIHLVKTGKTLFNDKIYAFKRGPVVENVRQAYCKQNKELINQAYNENIKLNDSQLDTLNIVTEIFGNLSGDELSEISHQQECWKEGFNNSNNNGYFDKDLQLIDIENIPESDYRRMNDMLKAYEQVKEMNNTCIEINNKKFYYDDNDIAINDELVEQLENFDGEDEAYTIYTDISQGLVVY